MFVLIYRILILRNCERDFEKRIISGMFILFIMIALWNVYFIYGIKIKDNNLKYWNISVILLFLF